MIPSADGMSGRPAVDPDDVPDAVACQIGAEVRRIMAALAGGEKKALACLDLMTLAEAVDRFESRLRAERMAADLMIGPA